MDLEPALSEGYSQETTVASLAVVNAGTQGGRCMPSHQFRQSVIGELVNESPNGFLGHFPATVFRQGLRAPDTLTWW